MPQEDQLNSYWQRKREMDQQLRLRAANEMQLDPDRSTRILNVTGITGLPEEVVDSDLESLEDLIKRRNFDAQKYMEQAPKFAEFAAENPYHLSVLNRDRENLTMMERAMVPIFMGIDAGWAQVEKAELIDRQIREGGVARPGDEEKLKELSAWEKPHEFGASNWVAKWIVKAAKIYAPMHYVVKSGLTTGMGGAIVGGTAGVMAGPGAPLTVPATATLGFGVAAYTGAGMATFKLERAFAYDEYKELGFSHEEALVASSAVGAVNAALEPLALGKLVKYFPGVKQAKEQIAKQLVEEVLKKPTMKQATGAVMVRFGEVLGTEVLVEVLQESSTIAGGEILKALDGGHERMSLAQYFDRVGHIALETLQAASLMSAIGPGFQYYNDIGRAKQAKQMETAYKALGEGSENSRLKKDVETKYVEWVRRLTKDGPVQNILIDIDRFKTYFQEVGQDPDQVATELGIDLEEAAAQGTDLEIPLAAYAEKVVGTEHHTGLTPDIKTHESQMTAREGVVFEQTADALRKSLMNDEPPPGHVPVDEILQQIIGENLAMNYDQETAENNAAITEAAFSTMARRNGIEPIELFNKYWGGLEQELPEVFQKRDVDIFVDPLLDRLRTGDVPVQRDIYGESLTEFLIKQGGLVDDGGELAAQDLQKEFKNLVREGGRTLDSAAEIAFEAGYIPEYDDALLLEQINREVQGLPVFGRGADPEMAALSRTLDELAEILEKADIDINTTELTNAEIRKLLRGDQRFEQMDDTIEIPGQMPDGILSRQIFGDLEIVQPVRIIQRKPAVEREVAETRPEFLQMQRDLSAAEIVLSEVLEKWRNAPRTEQANMNSEINQELDAARETVRKIDDNMNQYVTESQTATIDRRTEDRGITRRAQDVFDGAVKRLDGMQRLLECVNA